MNTKHLICPEKVRRVPNQFSWIDHRLVREHYIENVSHKALALYLFLVTVADQWGLSYYSDKSLGSRLAMNPPDLTKARNELVRAKLIAYRKPLFQVLSLDAPKIDRVSLDAPVAVSQILKRLAGVDHG